MSVTANYIGYGALVDTYLTGVRSVGTVYVVEITESFGASDILGSFSITKILTDTVTANENVAKHGSFVRSFIDAFSGSEVLRKTVTKKIVDILVANEIFNKFLTITINILESFGASETLTRSIRKRLQDSVGFDENIVKSISKTILETFGVSEKWAVFKNGVYQRWGKIKRAITSYTDIKRRSTDYTDIKRREVDYTDIAKREVDYDGIKKKETIWSRITKL